MEIYCVDTNPNSAAKGGAYEDVSLVKKYEISEEDYAKRANTVRAYKKEMLRKKKLEQQNQEVPGEDTVKDFIIGNRCKVYPGDRRGTIRWKGEWKDEPERGYWLGIEFDEPVGSNDGKHKGVEYFKCQLKYGSFVRGKNVESILYIFSG